MALKPWPTDAIMILAFPKLKPGVIGYPVQCRYCERSLLVSEKCRSLGAELGSNGGRPVKYLCHACYAEYDVNTIMLAGFSGESSNHHAN